MSPTNENQAPVTPQAIDASCRWPLLILFTGAAGWLFVSTVLGFLATMKFHMPGMFANCPFFSYGRLVASSNSLLIYGFGVPAAMGAAMWIMARLSRAPLALGPVAAIAAHFWHAGVLVMWVLLGFGGLTGHEWFEVPRGAAFVLFGSFIALALPVVLTLAARREKELYPSQWFILAAVFWFAWIFATACFAIHCQPASGLVQAAVQYWYGRNLVWVFFAFNTLAIVFYLLPKLVDAPLYSRELAGFTFWTLLILGSLGGVPHGAPLPAWLGGVNGATAALLLVPVIAAAVNCHLTAFTHRQKLRGDTVAACTHIGMLLFVVGAVMSAFLALRPFNDWFGLTMFQPAINKLLLQGFMVLTFFAAILHIMPQVAGAAWPRPALIKVQFGATTIGLVFAVVFLAVGGVKLGLMQQPLDAPPFEQVIVAGLNFIRMGSLGDLIMAVGHLCLFANLALLAVQQRRACCACCSDAACSTKTAEVTA
jgi:cytochrome c oxidase cbb3-type subunit I